MWSLGCILAELLTGYALFPGEDESDQLACIIELLGMPPQPLLDHSKRTKIFFSAKGFPRYCSTQTLEDGNIVLGSGSSRQGKERGPPASRSLQKALKGCDDPLFLNFLCGCLEWDPEVRMTPSAALKHSWFRRRLPRPPQPHNKCEIYATPCSSNAVIKANFSISPLNTSNVLKNNDIDQINNDKINSKTLCQRSKPILPNLANGPEKINSVVISTNDIADIFNNAAKKNLCSQKTEVNELNIFRADENSSTTEISQTPQKLLIGKRLNDSSPILKKEELSNVHDNNSKYRKELKSNTTNLSDISKITNSVTNQKNS